MSILTPGVDPDAGIESEKVTTFFAVPTMLVGLLEALEQVPRDMAEPL